MAKTQGDPYKEWRKDTVRFETYDPLSPPIWDTVNWAKQIQIVVEDETMKETIGGLGWSDCIVIACPNAYRHSYFNVTIYIKRQGDSEYFIDVIARSSNLYITPRQSVAENAEQIVEYLRWVLWTQVRNIRNKTNRWSRSQEIEYVNSKHL